jgi:CheY-like chemotaxis protein
MLQVPKSVCVVDDDKIYQFTTARMIQLVDDSVRVLSFGDGAQAIRHIHEHVADSDLLPDMILLDINMPCMDGWEFLNAYDHLKDGLAKDIKIYVVSSSIDERDVSRAKSIGCVSDYVVKPVTTDRLRELLLRYASSVN